jgi:serine/threonine-protein kinase
VADQSEEKSVLGKLSESGQEVPQVRLKRLEGEKELPVFPFRRDGPRYEILGEIGRGGVGVVFHSLDVDLGRDVAMKVLREEHAKNPEVARRFVEEAKIEGQLQHPGIVPVYDLGLQADKRPFFTMKLVSGETYSSLLSSRKDTSEERRRVLSIFEMVCRTMAYAHDRGVVHRDLKPSNVLLGSYGEVQVIDWGFAKVLAKDEPEGEDPEAKRAAVRIGRVRSGSGSTGSLAGTVMGTPAYMPPEQAKGKVDELDERSDVFALGAILCEILTGEPPYKGKGKDVLSQAFKGEVAEAQQRLLDCDADEVLVAMARKCLSPEKEDRPRNASILAEAVSEHLTSLEQRAHRAKLRAIEEEEKAARRRAQAEEAEAEAEEQRRKRKRTIILSGVILLAILAAGAGYLWIEEGRRERGRRATAAVDEVLEETARLRGKREFVSALAAAQRAWDLAQVDGVNPEIKRQSEEILATVIEEEEQARIQAKRDAENSALISTLLELRVAPDDAIEESARAVGIATAFREFGIDLDTLSPEAAAEKVLDREVAEEMISALDALATFAPDGPALAAARAADPDEIRNTIRDEAARGDTEALRTRAKDANPKELPGDTLALIAQKLNAAGEWEATIELLGRAYTQYPGHLFQLVHITEALERIQEDPELERIARLRTVTIAIRPQSFYLRERLARALLAAGHADRAAAHWRVLGEMLMRGGELDRAVDTLLRSEETYGETEEPRVWALLAQTYAMRGETELARERLARTRAWKEGKELINEELLRLEREAEAALDAREK